MKVKKYQRNFTINLKTKKISELPIFELGHTEIFENFNDEVADLKNYIKKCL